MAEKKDFNPEKDIEFSVVNRLKKKLKSSVQIATEEDASSSEPMMESGSLNSSLKSPANAGNVVSNETQYRRGLFFDYFSTNFQEMLASTKPPFTFVIVKDLSNLTQALKTSPQQVLFINWSINPKVYEQLLVQINSKFPSIHIIISGTDLNSERAKEIKAKYGFVKGFMMLPASLDQLKKVLQIN